MQPYARTNTAPQDQGAVGMEQFVAGAMCQDVQSWRKARTCRGRIHTGTLEQGVGIELKSSFGAIGTFSGMGKGRGRGKARPQGNFLTGARCSTHRERH